MRQRGFGRPDTLLFGAAAATAAAGVAAIEPDAVTQALVLAPFVALLGIPHGALDLRLAEALWPLPRVSGLALFGVAYLGLAAAVLGIWWLLPAAALGLFLAYSAVHFGGDWRDELTGWQRPFAGALVVSLPAVFWPNEVREIFATLAPAEAATGAVTGLRLAAPLAAVGVLAACAGARWRTPRTAVELAGLTVAAAALPPLVYFLVYFCFLHSPRHLAESARTLGLDAPEALRAAAPLTLATWAIAAVALALLLQAGVALGSTTLHVVFIGLAALAVPHMVLVERFWMRAR